MLDKIQAWDFYKGSRQLSEREKSEVERIWNGRAKGNVREVQSVTRAKKTENVSMCYVPMYYGTYEYSGTHYTVTVNGISGHVEGKRPWNTMKIAGICTGLFTCLIAYIII